MIDLDSLYSWFDENRESIIEQHQNEQVLLKDFAVVGYYPDLNSALIDAKKKGFVLGDFLIQDCISKEEDVILFYPLCLQGSKT